MPAVPPIPKGPNWLPANWHLIPSVGLFALVSLWFITYGSGNLFERPPASHLESVYDGLAERLAQGKFDVPPEAIQGEAFRVGGGTYTYFPPTPALPRMVLNKIWPDMYGRWAKAFSLFFGIATLLGTLALYRSWRDAGGTGGTERRDRRLELLLVACAGFGSTTLWLEAKAVVYHEAPLWAAGLSVWAAVFVVHFWRTRRIRHLAAGCALAFFAFFARGSTALGVLALLAAVAGLEFLQAHASRLPEWLARAVGRAPGVCNWRTPVWLVAGTLAVTAGIYLWYNWVRWGDPFDTQPVRYNIAYVGERIEHIHGRVFNSAAIPRNFLNYWMAPTVSPASGFPWVRFGKTWLGETEAIPYAYFEHHASLPASSAALVALFIAGAVVAVRGARGDVRALLLVGCLFAGSVPLLAYLALCHRYNHDFYPALAAGACIALVALRGTGRRFFASTMTALGMLSVYSAFVTFGLAWVFQRDLMFAMPEARRAQLARISRGIDEVAGGLATPVRFARAVPNCVPKTEPDGPRLKLFDCETQTWRSIPKPVNVDLEVQVPGGTIGSNQPLLTLGPANSAERIYLAFEAGDRVHFGYEHWGGPPVISDAIKARAGDTLQVSATIDSIHDEVRVRVNGVEVLADQRRLYDWGDGGPLFGKYPMGVGSSDTSFSGQLKVKPD